MTRLRAAELAAEDAVQVENFLQEIECVRFHWRTHWKQKVEREIPNRLRLWKNYLDDWGDSSPTKAGDYHYNVRLRVILEL